MCFQHKMRLKRPGTGCWGLIISMEQKKPVSLDTLLKIQSARAQLDHLNETKVDELEELNDCLEGADDNLRDARKQAPEKSS